MVFFCDGQIHFHYTCRKTELEESLAFSERFYEEVDALLEWLFMIEPSLSKDVNVHGDIHTVDGLIKKHEVIQNSVFSQPAENLK